RHPNATLFPYTTLFRSLSQYSHGAYTGEVSASMLVDFGVRFVIVGHSERRALFGESDQLVAEKFKAAQTAKLIPILCVGETLTQDRKSTRLNSSHEKI